MKKFLLFFVICISSKQYAQYKISVSEFLEESNRVFLQKSVILDNQLDNLSFKVPFINELEFRTETKDFRLTNQEYVLRFKPIGFGAKRNTIETYETKINQIKLENQIVFKENLKERYKLIIDFIFIDDLLHLLPRNAFI